MGPSPSFRDVTLFQPLKARLKTFGVPMSCVIFDRVQDLLTCTEIIS
jgi:hypothetical protein